MIPLLGYWPSLQEIDGCIKAEAETAPDAVLMAVHQTPPLVIRDAGTVRERVTTERKLLDAFLTPNVPEGYLLMAITGTSGAGKSHVIRWLAAQLSRDPRAQHMHIIRIPKSANLREVVGLILEPLKGDERYEGAAEELKTAVSAITPHEAGVHLAATLEIALSSLAGQLLTLAKQRGGPVSKELKLRAHHARKVPLLFGDAVLKHHFNEKVLAPIIKRAVSGSDGNYDTLPQFSAEDLVIPADLDLGEASAAVQNYCLTSLNKDDGAGRELAVGVLNEVLDEAVRGVFKLSQAMGGVTLEEMILRIRELLQQDGRELVLLVEDFAALPGIQEILLRVCIQEAIRDGQEIRSTMRTALAVTDGYLTARDTILTRAKREWVVRAATDDTTKDINRMVELVGGYLNAARWGSTHLKKMFEEVRNAGDAELTGWLDRYEDGNISPEESEMLSAFGSTDQGVPLFPFNREAIKALAEQHMIGGSLQFTPRAVINYILREILLRRQAFETRRFPPSDFQRKPLAPGIADWLSRAQVDEGDRGRIASAINLWCGAPEDATQLSELSPALFHAFGLPAPRELGSVPERGEITDGYRRLVTKPAKTGARPGHDDPRDDGHPDAAKWSQRLQDWVSGNVLSQQDARLIRTAIAAALESAIDWNALCMLRQKIRSTMIDIPQARGNPPDGSQRISIAEDASDSDGTLRRTLLAFVRYHDIHKKSLGYPEADEDSGLIANFIEGLLSRLELVFRENARQEAAQWGSILIRQSRVLGLGPTRRGQPALLNAIRSSPSQNVPETTADPVLERWCELRRDAVAHRCELQQELWSKVCCFQGTGATPYGIDACRIPAEYSEDNLGSGYERTAGQLRTHVGDLREVRLRARLRPVVERLRILERDFRSHVPRDVPKAKLLSSLKNLEDELENAALWPTSAAPRPELRHILAEFQDAPAIELMSHIESLKDDEQEVDEVLDCLGKLDLATLRSVETFVTEIPRFLDALDRDLGARQQAAGDTDVESNAETVAAELERLGTILQEFV